MVNCMSPWKTKHVFPSLRIKPLFQTFIQFSSEKFIDITFLQSGKIKPHRVNFFLGSALHKLFLRNKLSPAQLV